MEILIEQKLCRKGLHWYPVADKQCKECGKISRRNWYLANRKHALEINNKWAKANPEHVRENKKKWARANPERVSENRKKWRQANPECMRKHRNKWARANREKTRKNSKKWRQANPEHLREYRKSWAQANSDKVNAIKARRRATKRSALAPWANASSIKNFYTEARRLTKLMGVKHHVDHIYPLQSEYMCGLHVETNLQILTEKENISKGNRTWPGQLECQKGSVYARFPKELTDLLND